MYIKIDPASEIHCALLALSDEIIQARTAARKICEEVGCERHREAIGGYAGGISAFEFTEQKVPKGWRKIRGGFSFPKRTKDNTDLIDRIKALPKVSTKRFSEIIHWNIQVVGGRLVTSPWNRMVRGSIYDQYPRRCKL